RRRRGWPERLRRRRRRRGGSHPHPLPGRDGAGPRRDPRHALSRRRDALEHDGEAEAEAGALAGLALHPDLAAVAADDLAADVKAEADAVGGLAFGLAELVEDLLLLLGGD